MKTFSFLHWFTFVCLAFALVLVGKPAESANHEEAGLKVIFPEKPGVIELINNAPADPIPFTVQLTDADGIGIEDAVIRFTSIPNGAVNFFQTGTMTSATTDTTDSDGIAVIDIQLKQAGTITIRGTLDLDASIDNGVDPEGLIDDAFAGHDYKVIDVKVVEKDKPVPVPYAAVEKTKIVVLPPIPCSDEHQLLSHLVSSYLSDGKVEERVETELLTPASLEEIQTHKGLLDAIGDLRNKLKGLAARWDDPDDPDDPDDMEPPTDMDAPSNMFRVPIVILNANDLSGWQFDIAYNPQILEVIEVSAGNYAIYEGDFLKQGPAMTFFQPASEVNNAAGEIIRISQARVAKGDEVNDTTADLVPQGSPGWAAEITDRKPTDSIDGADGTGELVSICFRVKEFAEESLGLHNVQLSDSVGNRLNFTTIVHPVVVTHQFAAEDVNRDTVVNTKDLMVIAASLGLAKPINPRADVNNDGIVNALDLVIVAQHIMDRTPAVEVRARNMPAPAIPGSVEALDLATIQGWIDMAHLEDDGSVIFDLGIANLEALLASKTPFETKLLLNYPNPFNPETWIPYQLAEATDVTISIYAVNGNLIRSLALGHQAAGTYHSKNQAAYWDGRNELGERVASGVYFYTFTAGNFSATGKMLVRK